jgi:cell division protein FtsN
MAADAKSTEDTLTKDPQSVTGPLTSLDTVTDEKFFLQVGAFRRIELAAKLRVELLYQTQREVKVRADEPTGFYRVWVGPFADPLELQQVSKKLEELNMGKPQLISE